MDAILKTLDAALGWLLAMPRDWAIVLLAVGTSFGMTLVRKLVTDQERLGRCAEDLARLKQLMRESKRAGDSDGVRRRRATMSTIQLMRLGAEGRVLAVALVPLALLGWWGMERLSYYPLKAGEKFAFHAEYRPSAIGKLTHLVPPDGLTMASPAVRLVESSSNGRGEAAWTLKGDRPGETDLIVRCQRRSATQRVRIGGGALPPVQDVSGGPIERTWVALEEYRSPLTRWVGREWLPAPEWMWFYLLLTLALMPVSRRLLRTH